jgi:hypothetical protein
MNNISTTINNRTPRKTPVATSQLKLQPKHKVTSFTIPQVANHKIIARKRARNTAKIINPPIARDPLDFFIFLYLID